MTTRESAEVRASAREARKRARQAKRRNEFLDAARVALRARGITEMTLADVAREAGESETLLYYYFRNRDDLLTSLAVSTIIRDIEAMRDAVEKAPNGVEALAAIIRALVALYRDDLESFKLRMWVTMRRLPQGALDEFYPRINGMVDCVEAKLREDQRRGIATRDMRPRVRAGVALTQAEGLLTNYALIHGVGAEISIGLDTMVEEACKQAIRGVRLDGG